MSREPIQAYLARGNEPWDLTCGNYPDGCRNTFPVAVGEDVDVWWPRAEAAGWDLGNPEGDGTGPYWCPYCHVANWVGK